jgi:ligand-binding sensor domain-containing protein
MLGPVSLQQVFEVLAEFDDSGGASLGLVAWELGVDEELVASAWRQAIDHELIRAAGRDSQEQLWRLTSAGRAVARRERRSSQADGSTRPDRFQG